MPNKKLCNAPNATKRKANLPPRKPVNLFARKWSIFGRVFMAPGRQSRPSRLASPRLAALASTFLLPARKLDPLARRREDLRPNLPGNAPIPRSAHCVARVPPPPLPTRSLVLLKPAPVNAVPQAVIVPPRKLLKPDHTTDRSGAVSSDNKRLTITGLQP